MSDFDRKLRGHRDFGKKCKLLKNKKAPAKFLADRENVALLILILKISLGQKASPRS